MQNFVVAFSLFAGALCVQPALAAGITYDCQSRLARVETAPPPDPAEANPWQCPVPKVTVRPSGTHWFRDSLEYCRLSVNVYDQALAVARRMAKTHRRNQWVVTLDADETVLDNSLFEREGDACASNYSDRAWRNWVSATTWPSSPPAVRLPRPPRWQRTKPLGTGCSASPAAARP